MGVAEVGQMPVSKKRKKEGKPVHRKTPAGESAAGAEQQESHQAHPDARSGKPKNPFVSQQAQRRGAQRGR
jgi:hypothetical protein